MLKLCLEYRREFISMICACILIILSFLLQLPPIILIMMIITGLVLGTISTISITKLLIGGKK